MTDTTEREAKPCPFCGAVGLDFGQGSTFRWITASCSGCGATTGETRIQTFGQGTRDEWLADARHDAIAAWNRRATGLVAQPHQPEVAAQAAAVPAGMVLVPLAPTVAMREAGHWAWMKATNEALEAAPGRQVDSPRSNIAAAYCAMVAAATGAAQPATQTHHPR